MKVSKNLRSYVPLTAFVDPSSQIIGNVRIGPNVFIGSTAVIRADEPGPGRLLMPGMC